jgi:hypothetical protein
VSLQTRREATVAAADTLVIGWSRGGPFKWTEVSMPPPPIITYAEAPEPVIQWKALWGSPLWGMGSRREVGPLAFYVACTDRVDLPVNRVVVSDEGSVPLEALLTGQGEQPVVHYRRDNEPAPADLRPCENVRIVVRRGRPFGIEELGFPGQAQCYSTQLRTLDIARKASVEIAQ